MRTTGLISCLLESSGTCTALHLLDAFPLRFNTLSHEDPRAPVSSITLGFLWVRSLPFERALLLGFLSTCRLLQKRLSKDKRCLEHSRDALLKNPTSLSDASKIVGVLGEQCGGSVVIVALERDDASLAAGAS